MHRRGFIGALMTGGVIAGLAAEARTFAHGAIDSTRERPWALRTHTTPITGREYVYDARTGEDVSIRVPYAAASRLERSRVTGKPMRIVVFRLDCSGQLLVTGNRVATEPAWVRIIS